jgi:hypothetical protein
MARIRFFVGDLCNVTNQDEWLEICRLETFYPGVNPDDFDPQGYLVPKDTYGDDPLAGRPFYLLKTATGDGYYQGNDGNCYTVSSGTIGAIAIDDILGKL